jgi:hypothetical protein
LGQTRAVQDTPLRRAEQASLSLIRWLPPVVRRSTQRSFFGENTPLAARGWLHLIRASFFPAGMLAIPRKRIRPVQITESENSLPGQATAGSKWSDGGGTAGKVSPPYERVNVSVMVVVNHLPKITSARLKGSSTASRYGSCYHPRIACRQARQRARQGYRIGLFESRIGSTGPGATNRVNCWFRPTFPHLAKASVPANESARPLAGQNPPDGNLASSLVKSELSKTRSELPKWEPLSAVPS